MSSRCVALRAFDWRARPTQPTKTAFIDTALKTANYLRDPRTPGNDPDKLDDPHPAGTRVGPSTRPRRQTRDAEHREQWHVAGNRGRVVSVGANGQRNRQEARPAPN